MANTHPGHTPWPRSGAGGCKRGPIGAWRPRHRHATLLPNRTGENHVRIVALEEHYTVPRIVAGISPEAIARRGFPGPDFVWAQATKRHEFADLGDARLADMDAGGITVQVLSVAGPGADLVAGQTGIDLARAYNDALAEAHVVGLDPTVRRQSTRCRGFAHLPMRAPDAATDELEHKVVHLGFHGVFATGATKQSGTEKPGALWKPRADKPIL